MNCKASIICNHEERKIGYLLSHAEANLRSKRFRLVSEQRKTKERGFRFWPREKRNESQTMNEGGGEGER